MAMQCTVCKRRYPAHALYCALCGQPLVAARTSPEARNVALTFAVLIAGGTALAVFGAAKMFRLRDVDATPVVTVQRNFDLCCHKADAVHALLAPRDIRVIVGKRDGGIRIEGTPREIEVLADFMDLLTRYEGHSAEQVRAEIIRARKHGAFTQKYKLPKSKGKVLYRILAGDDVPVLVSGSTRQVRVEATPRDQETLRLVVEILRGRRL